jgi:hypothetical protein
MLTYLINTALSQPPSIPLNEHTKYLDLWSRLHNLDECQSAII